VAYWLLTGRLVFQAPNAIQLLYQHANAMPVAPSQLSEFEIPPALDDVILACLAKFPEERPQSAAELSRRLAAAAVSPVWTEELAHRWWNRHHPEAAQAAPAEPHRMLTKTVEAIWEAEETPAPPVGAGKS
jgi:serine/threonine-protein kinase